MSKAFAVLVSILLLSPVAGAQTRAGGEFRLNTYTVNDQFLPAASADRRGTFVVTWGSGPGQDGNLTGAFGQRFDASGLSLGNEFRVNSYTTGSQVLFDLVNDVIVPPSIGHDARGNFVVVWSSSPGQDGSSSGIFAQRYDASGVRRGAEFRVNTTTAGNQIDAEVAVAPGGSFVVVWTGYNQPGDILGGIFGQRIDASGQPIGAEFHVNTAVVGDQEDPHLAMAPDGRFVVVWESSDAGGFGIFGQRFDSAGARAGAEFRVNTYSPGDQLHPTVAMDAAGNFVVAWHGATLADASGGILAQRHDASGNRLGAEFQVNTYTLNAQTYASVARDEAGNFVVTWFGDGAGDPSFGTFGRRFTSAGVGRGVEFMVNTSTIAYQGLGEVASDEVGNFMVTWTSFTPQDGSGMGAFAQRFGGVRPTALTVVNAFNQVWEPGESIVLQPTWQNVNGTTLNFNGVLSNLTGPAGATYIITAANAIYGSVLDGNTRACTTCYGVAVSDPSPRPAVHWDATGDERITPDALGQTKRWSLHLGRSFTDVPASNGFYRFIETLLHHGVTGGCAATTYCPANSTTREQMAVFVLAAKEGAGYVPAACTTPVFNDVPANSPFCRFIEELARRGVVSGCGGGNYCPTNPVTREQMSIFVLRTLDPALDPPPCVPPNLFADVPESSPFCRWIEELANRGVVTGCGGGNYCPTANVTREQMGVFIAASFGLSLYGP